MKVTFIAHASILVQASGLNILSDPWWAGPCFGAQWWVYPEPNLAALENLPVHYIYISHGHNDHLHPGTLTRFPRTTTILVSKEIDIAPSIREMGFPVKELSPQEEFDLGHDVKCRLMPTCSDDTLLGISDGKESCLNLNDALHAAPSDIQDEFIHKMKSLYGTIDYLFCGYGTASHFPNCYLIPGKDRLKTAARRQHHFNQCWVKIVNGLSPRFAFPFAADVVLLERELSPLNETIHNAERPTGLFRKTYPEASTTVADIAPGFSVENGTIISNCLRRPLSTAQLASDYASKIQKANNYTDTSSQDIDQLLELLRANVDLCLPYLHTFSGNYRCLIRLRNSAKALEIEKQGPSISVTVVSDAQHPDTRYDLICTTRASYLKQSLKSLYGNEILFVGSGALFSYSSASKVPKAIHRELIHIIQRHDECPPSRFGDNSQFVYQAKQAAKHLLGLEDEDLYDLAKWTVYCLFLLFLSPALSFGPF